MSSLAEILKLRGKNVRGSDMQRSGTTDALESKGIRVEIGQKTENIAENPPECVVRTDAVSDSNPAIVAATKRGTPVFRRSELCLTATKRRSGLPERTGKRRRLR